MANRVHSDDTEVESKKLSTVRNTKAIFEIACTSPTMLEASTDLAFYDTMILALTNWSVYGFKESLQYTIKFLRKSGICVNENGSDLCSIMNGVLEHDVRIGTKQHSHQVSPKGLLLLYCFAEYFNCTVFLFSTRKKPTIIKPVERDGATRKFAALLSHQDSYMQKTTWFSLTRKDGFTPNPSAFKAPSSHANVNNDIVATKFVEGSKKTIHKRLRIFGEKKEKTYKRKQRKRPKPQSEQAKKKQAMEKLFWLLDCDHRVDQCIDKQLGIIVSNNKKKPESKEPAAATTTGAPSPVSRKGKSRIDDSDLESVMDDELQEEEESRDLTAKEINALTSVSVMRCQSPSIKGDISSEYIKKQLYPHKRDSIPASALDCCSTIINAIKSLVPKEDFPSPYKWFGLFQLRNILVAFRPGLTRKNARSLFPTIEDTPSQKMAIALDPVTLYLLFSKQYHIYQKNKSAFTSNSMIKSIETKEDIFSNFFDVPKIKKILKEQKLDFKHYIKFKDQYNVHLVGSRVKKHNNGSKSGENRSSASESSVNRSNASKSDVDKVKKLSSDIKETKKQLSSLSRQLSKLQRHHMDCGNESRSWEKKHNSMNFELYKKLKDARSDYDELYMKVSSLKSSIKQVSSEMHILNKRIHGQQVH